MHFISFIVAFALILIATILFVSGLVRLHQGSEKKARGLMSSGLMVGVLGILASVIIFGFFSL